MPSAAAAWLALSIVVAPAPAEATPEVEPADPATPAEPTDPPASSFYETLKLADAAAGASQLTHAGDLYTQAYDELPETDRASETGSDIVGEAVQVYRDGFFVRPNDRTPLDSARALLERHIAALEANNPPSDTTEFVSQLAAVDALLAGLRTEEELESKPRTVEPSPRPDPTGESARHTDRSDNKSAMRVDEPDAASSRRHLLIGLGVGAGVSLAAGAGLIGYGAWFRGRTADLHSARASTLPPCSASETDRCTLDAWKDSEDQNANAFVGVGAAVAATGLALGITAAVLSARGRSKRRISAFPIDTQHGLGLVVAGRF